jgi:hypothetical protein
VSVSPSRLEPDISRIQVRSECYRLRRLAEWQWDSHSAILQNAMSRQEALLAVKLMPCPLTEKCRYFGVTCRTKDGEQEVASQRCHQSTKLQASYPRMQLFLVSWGGVRLSPLGTSATNWPIVPAPMIDDECGAVGGMRIGRGNRNIRRTPAPVPLCPPQIPHELTWARTSAVAVGNQRITA